MMLQFTIAYAPSHMIAMHLCSATRYPTALIVVLHPGGTPSPGHLKGSQITLGLQACLAARVVFAVVPVQVRGPAVVVRVHQFVD